MICCVLPALYTVATCSLKSTSMHACTQAANIDQLPQLNWLMYRWGSWVSATEEEEGQDEEMAEAPPTAAPKQEEEQEQSMIREAAIGKGILLSPTTHTTFFVQLCGQLDLAHSHCWAVCLVHAE